MKLIKLETQEQFDAITKKDILIVKWKTGSREYKKGTEFAAYTTCFINSRRLNELIVNERSNTYFSIDMYLNEDSFAEEVCLVSK